MKEEYDTLSDEELLGMLREGEQDIEEYLINKYKNLVRLKARSMYILGGDNDDLIQEGMIGLFKAIRDYDFGRDASFQTFAQLCISRQIYTAVQASGRQKHMPLNNAISFYAQHNKEMDGISDIEDGVSLERVLQAGRLANPETKFIDEENVEQLEQILMKSLSSFEYEVLQLHLTGMSYVEIAKVLGKSEKSTDNALQRIKMKVKKALETRSDE